MIAYVGMAVLTVFIGYMMNAAYSFLNVIIQNLNMANNPDIEKRIGGEIFEQTYHRADVEYALIKYVQLPAMALSLITTLGVLVLSFFGYTITMLTTIGLSLLIATTIYAYLKTDYFPEWLRNWHNLLALTHFQHHLEFVKSELTNGYVELKKVKAGTLILTPAELDILKRHVIVMASEVERVSALIDEYTVVSPE
jgi:hypothetical protein